MFGFILSMAGQTQFRWIGGGVNRQRHIDEQCVSFAVYGQSGVIDTGHQTGDIGMNHHIAGLTLAQGTACAGKVQPGSGLTDRIGRRAATADTAGGRVPGQA